MSYRLVLYAVPIDTDVGKIRGAAMAFVRTSAHDISARTLYLRILGDDDARAAGLRWFWFGTADQGGRVFTREAVSGSLGMDLPGLVEVVHDDQRGAYSFSATHWLVSNGGMLRGERKALTVEHPQAGKTNAEIAKSNDPMPNAVTLGLRQWFPEASAEPMARLRVLKYGTTFQLRPERDAAVEVSDPLMGFVDPWLRDLPEEDDPIDPSATPEAAASRQADALQAEASALLERKEWDAAEATLRRAVELAPWHNVAWEQLIGISLHRERSAEAFARLRELTDARDRLPAMWRPQLQWTIDNRLSWIGKAMAELGELTLLRELIAWARANRLTWPNLEYYARALAGKQVDGIDPPPPWERKWVPAAPHPPPAAEPEPDEPKRGFPQYLAIGLAFLVLLTAVLLLVRR